MPVRVNADREARYFASAQAEPARRNGGSPAVPGLTQALFDPSSTVKRTACKALGKIGSERAVPALEYSQDQNRVAIMRRNRAYRVDFPQVSKLGDS